MTVSEIKSITQEAKKNPVHEAFDRLVAAIMGTTAPSETLETKSPAHQAFERLQVANRRRDEFLRVMSRLSQKSGEAENEVTYAQRAYSDILSKSRTIDAMKRA